MHAAPLQRRAAGAKQPQSRIFRYLPNSQRVSIVLRPHFACSSRQGCEGYREMAQLPRVVGAWVLEGELGRGSFVVVHRAHHTESGQPAAVKEINTDKLNKKLQESLASEVSVLSQTKHRNVVGLLDLLKVGRGGTA